MVEWILPGSAGQHEQGVQRFGRIGFLQRAIAPVVRVLVLNRHSSCEADEAILMPKIRPGSPDRGGVLFAVKCFKFPAHSLNLVELISALRSFGGLLAHVAYAVKAGLCLAAADSEVEGAVVRVDDDIGERQWGSSQELFGFRLVSSPVRRQVQCVKLSVAPVANEERLLVLGRETRAVTETHAGWRTWPDVVDGRQTVRVVGGPFAGAVTPAEVASGGHQADARGPVPRGVYVPFHVGVVS